VPWLRGQSSPWQSFRDQLSDSPVVMGISVALAFFFPLVVGVYSSVATRVSTRDMEYRAQFPDLKPDPVFRADSSGRIVDIGAATQQLFERHQIETGRHFMGDEQWTRLWASASEPSEGATVVYSETLEAWYAVSTAPGPAQTLNVYATRAQAPEPRADASRGAAEA